MTILLAAAGALLFAIGTYLILQRKLKMGLIPRWTKGIAFL